ncbi:MAG: YciI family protein [Xanthomonadaceae bacterium]|jgi:hypothetical protein|nr:YciI family protein [Xanthomonadaceae bacterium]
MHYAILGLDAPDALPRRRELRAAHLARVALLRDAGRVLLAGPLPAIDAPDPGPAGFAGSLIVAEFDSLAEAQAWAEADPYRAGGVWAAIQVHPFLRVV